MPTHTQVMLSPPVTAPSAMGKADSARVAASFPASPIHSGEITDTSITAQFQELVLDGVVNDGGHTFGEFNRDYADAPDLNEVKTGAGGLPASPYVPNPVSPGPGSMNPSDQGAPPDGFGATPNGQWGTGVGSALQPKSSSEAISKQKLGDYIMGKAVGA